MATTLDEQLKAANDAVIVDDLQATLAAERARGRQSLEEVAGSLAHEDENMGVHIGDTITIHEPTPTPDEPTEPTPTMNKANKALGKLALTAALAAAGGAGLAEMFRAPVEHPAPTVDTNTTYRLRLSPIPVEVTP